MSRAREIADRDLAATELILDADNDTSITADTDDQIDLKVGGTDTLVVKSDVVEIKGSHPDLKLMDTDDNNYGGLFYNNGSMTLATDHDATGATGIIKFAIDGNEDVRIDGGGDLKINDGNLIIGTSGHGIDFSAVSTSASGSNSALLDDYEEGTFGISMTVATGTFQISSSYNLLSYTKIGQRVFISGGIRFAGANSGGSPSGAVHIDDLPFTPASASEDEIHSCFFVAHDSMTGLSSGGQAMIGQILPSNTNIFLFTQDQNGFADCGNHFTDNSILRFNFSYISA